jgi:hypothetical protein
MRGRHLVLFTAGCLTTAACVVRRRSTLFRDLKEIFDLTPKIDSDATTNALLWLMPKYMEWSMNEQQHATCILTSLWNNYRFDARYDFGDGSSNEAGLAFSAARDTAIRCGLIAASWQPQSAAAALNAH